MAAFLALLGAATPAQAKTTAGPDPVVQEWPSWPYPTVCHSLAFDPVAVFSSPTGVEFGSRPSEVALKRELQEMEGWDYRLVPPNNWRLLAETSNRAEFASGRLLAPGGPSVISVEKKSGVWKMSGLSSGCTPRSIVGEHEAITWTLAESQKALKRGTKTIKINLGPGPCASGRSQNARAMKPVFERMDDRLLMIMRLRPLPPGGYTCEGIVDPPLKVRLPESLGNSKLYDGGVYPPTDVAKLWRETFR